MIQRAMTTACFYVFTVFDGFMDINMCMLHRFFYRITNRPVRSNSSRQGATCSMHIIGRYIYQLKQQIFTPLINI